MAALPLRCYRFYRDGFRAMRLGRTLWAVVLIKLLVLFAVQRIFFPDLLHTRFATDGERAGHVLEQLSRLPGGRR